MNYHVQESGYYLATSVSSLNMFPNFRRCQQYPNYRLEILKNTFIVTTVFAAVAAVFTAVVAENTDEAAVTNIAATSVKFQCTALIISFS